jgi:hypothetical protein
MLKIRLRKTRLVIEINWPTKPKETKTIGPFFEKIEKNAIQVSRKGIFIVITLGKQKRKKWGQLTTDPDEYPLHMRDLEKIKNERNFKDEEKFVEVRQVEEKSESGDEDVEMESEEEKAVEGVRKIIEEKMLKKYSHLPIFGAKGKKASRSKSRSRSRKSYSRKSSRINKSVEREKSRKERSIGRSSIYSKNSGLTKSEILKKQRIRENKKIVSEKLTHDGDHSILTLQSENTVNPFQASPQIRRGLMGTYVPRWSQNNSRKASFSKKKFPKNNSRSSRSPSGMRKRPSYGPAVTPKTKVRVSQEENILFENSNPSKIKQRKLVKKKKKIEDMAKRVLKSLTPNTNQNRFVKQKMLKSKKKTEQVTEERKTRYWNQNYKSSSKRSRSGYSKSREQGYSIKKLKQEMPAMKSELQSVLKFERGESVDKIMTRRKKRSKSKRKKRKRRKSWEKKSRKERYCFSSIIKMVDNQEVLMQLQHYTMFNEEEKGIILDNLIEVLKQKLLVEQQTRMMRESELEDIMTRDNQKVLELVRFAVIFRKLN